MSAWFNLSCTSERDKYDNVISCDQCPCYTSNSVTTDNCVHDQTSNVTTKSEHG